MWRSSKGLHRVVMKQVKELQGMVPKDMEGVIIPGTYYSALDAAMALSKCASLPCVLKHARKQA